MQRRYALPSATAYADFQIGRRALPQLDAANNCKIFGQVGRPVVCASLQPAQDMCGADRVHEMLFLSDLERLTT